MIQADRDEGRWFDGLTSGEREELPRLRRENRRLRQELEILTKAAAWFAGEPARSRPGLRVREGQPAMNSFASFRLACLVLTRRFRPTRWVEHCQKPLFGRLYTWTVPPKIV